MKVEIKDRKRSRTCWKCLRSILDGKPPGSGYIAEMRIVLKPCSDCGELCRSRVVRRWTGKQPKDEEGAGFTADPDAHDAV